VVVTLSISKLGYLLRTEYRSMGWCAKEGRRILAFRRLISKNKIYADMPCSMRKDRKVSKWV